MKYGLVTFISLVFSQAFAVEVYQCSDHGIMLFTDEPCSSQSQHSKTIIIPDAELSRHSVGFGDSSHTAAQTEIVKVTKGRLQGHWRRVDKLGSEDRFFYKGGRFESSGENKFAKVTGIGTWTLHGNQIVIDVAFMNEMHNGERISLNRTLEYLVKSFDDHQMKLYWPSYGSSDTWVRQ